MREEDRVEEKRRSEEETQKQRNEEKYVKCRYQRWK